MKSLFQFLPVVALMLLLAAFYTQASSSSSSSNARECKDTYTCAGLNEACTTSWNINTNNTCSDTKGKDCCASGLLCFNGQCAPDNVNSACQFNSDCLSATDYTSLVCYNNNCTYIGYAGDSCDSDLLCYPGFQCTAGICRGPTLGQSCQSEQCDIGLFCNINFYTCQAIPQLNEPCSDNECAAGTFCYNGTCQEYWTLCFGDSCTFEGQCAEGLTCNQDSNTCIYSTIPYPYPTCTTDSDCPANSTCTCSQLTGTSTCAPNTPQNNVCTEEQAKMYDCIFNNSVEFVSANPGSRFLKYCSSEWQDYQECMCVVGSSEMGSCYYSPYCTSSPPNDSNGLTDLFFLKKNHKKGL